MILTVTTLYIAHQWQLQTITKRLHINVVSSVVGITFRRQPKLISSLIWFCDKHHEQTTISTSSTVFKDANEGTPMFLGICHDTSSEKCSTRNIMVVHMTTRSRNLERWVKPGRPT